MMIKILVCLSVLFSMFSCTEKRTDNEKAMYGMVERLIPAFAGQFEFNEINLDSIDNYEIKSKGGKIVISGNNANSMAVGLNHYLKYYCLTTVSWYLNDSVEMPAVLPAVSEPVTGSAKCKDRFFLNYCTFGYTMPWWKWQDWERLIDWMALNGINMPLAITGQESVWYNVWSKLGLSDDEIRSYFTGPAHLPWHRMSNLDYWHGGLPKEWLENQKELQKQIVKREREFNMTPILPAFAGHVPKELKTIYPDAKISQMSSWGGFKDEYRSHFLDPMDSLFTDIQKLFLEEQTALFGTDHIYGADPFNEVAPPSWEPEFLNKASEHIYQSIANVDPDATWLQMTWLFYIDRHQWTNERVKSFLHGTPQDKMLLLDYYCENTEVWKQTEKYFGQPYIWCYLGNFGGNTMLSGNIKEVGTRIDNVFENGGENFTGLGSTLEGFDVNPFMYEYVFEKAWDNMPHDEEWISKLSDRRYGNVNPSVRQVWHELYDSVYIDPAKLGQGTLTNARPALTGQGNWTTSPAYVYNNKRLFEMWDKLIQQNTSSRETYKYDLANIGRQVLGNHFSVMRDQFTQAYESKDTATLLVVGDQMKSLLMDLNTLLSTQQSFLVGKWIEDARSFGVNDEQKAYYEKNARNLLSTWGDKDQSLNDYANRSWSGMTSGYYYPRWSLFIDQVILAAKQNKAYDQAAFHKDVTELENEWVSEKNMYSSQPVGDALSVSKMLVEKYKDLINN